MARILRVNIRSSFQLLLSTSLHLEERQGSFVARLTRRWYAESGALEEFFDQKQSLNDSLGTMESKDQPGEAKTMNRNDMLAEKDKLAAHYDSILYSKREAKGDLVAGLSDFSLSKFKAGAAYLNKQGNEPRNAECKTPSNLDPCRSTKLKDQLSEGKLTDKDAMPDKDRSTSGSISGLDDFLVKLKAGAGNLNRQENMTTKTESSAPPVSDDRSTRQSESKILNLNKQGNDPGTIGVATASKLDAKAAKANENQIWDNVLRSIGNLSPKSESSSNSLITKENEMKDDFLDLDLPGVSEDTISSSDAASRRPLFNLFKSPPSVKAKGGGFPLPGNNQRSMHKSNADIRSPPPNVNTACCTELLDKDKNSSKMDGPPLQVDAASSCVDDIGQHEGHTVCIQNLPAGCNLGIVRDALSQFGVVTGSFRKPGSNGLCACYVEFQDEDAMEVAVAARWLIINGRCFPILRTDQPTTTVVRLTKVNPDTVESQVVSICGKYGTVDTVKKRGNGVFDVYYTANERPHIFKILNSLNEVQTNYSRWVAVPASVIHHGAREEVIRRKDGKAWVSSQMGRTLHRIELALETAAIALEDLKSLNSLEDGVQQLTKS